MMTMECSPTPIIGALESHNEVNVIHPKLGQGINIGIGIREAA